MQVIITMAGLGSRFSAAGFVDPKPIVPVVGKPALAYLIESFSKSWKLFFVLADHDKNSKIESAIQNLRPDSKIIYTEFSKRGPIDTVLAAIPCLNHAEPVLTAYCDLVVFWDCDDFEKKVKGYDAAVVNYQGFHPSYLGPNSYCHVQVDEKNQTVIRLQEKKLFTDCLQNEITSAGFYYFKNPKLLTDALNLQLEQDLKFGNEFYISLAVQALLNKFERSNNIQVLDYRVDYVVQFGTPEDIERFEYWYRYFNSIDQNPNGQNSEKFNLEMNYWKKVFKLLNFDFAT